LSRSPVLDHGTHLPNQIAHASVANALQAFGTTNELRNYAVCTTTSLVAVAAYAAFGLWSPGRVNAQPADPKIKKTRERWCPMKKAILFGRVTPERLILQLELESAEAIWMQMGTPPTWDLHTPGKDKQDHVEFKLTDPQSNTRVPYAGTSFKATNT
jgi:hypothetical protein